MFESRERLAEEVRGLLGALRALGQGRYTCVLEPGRLVFEEPEPDSAADWRLRRFLEAQSEALFRIPAGMASGAPLEDAFEGWEEDEFFLAFINGRVAVVMACPNAEDLRDKSMKPLKALADRLFRWEPRYRMDPEGRGFFFGRARLDVVIVGGRPEAEG